MKALVVYDSQWGNTEQIAWAIGGALGAEPDVLVLPVGQTTPERLTASGLDLVVVGSPTQGFRPTKPVAELLQRLPEGGLDADLDLEVLEALVAASVRHLQEAS